MSTTGAIPGQPPRQQVSLPTTGSGRQTGDIAINYISYHQ